MKNICSVKQKQKDMNIYKKFVFPLDDKPEVNV